MRDKTFNQKNKRTTIKTIAEKAGVSIATVSGVLNNSSKITVKKETKEKIFKIANELNYHPNYIARSLKKNRTDTIGFIAPLLESGMALSDIEILEALTRDRNYQLIIGYSKSSVEREREILEEFYYRQVDGVILIPTGLSLVNEVLKKLKGEKFPVVAITKPYGVTIPFVSTDYKKGGFLAAEYLIKTGHKRIGFLGGLMDFYSVRERFKGFKSAFEKYSRRINKSLIFTIPAEKYDKRIEEVSSYIISKKIDGIFVSSDNYAVMLMKIMISKGIKVPDDLSIIGFNDSGIVKFAPVPLTTIKQPVEKITKKAFDILFDMIEGKRENRGREILFEPELIIRNSVKRR